MRIHFPYDDIPALDVADKQLRGVVSPRDAYPSAPAADLIREALDRPLGSPTLRALGHSARRVLILCDDNTRPTPVHLVLPAVLERLTSGSRAPEIGFMIASGTHRPMTMAEKAAKLGAEICRNYPVWDHRWDEPSELTYIGETKSGIPVKLNRHLLEFDLLIGIGHVAPHRMAGFGGGSKIVQPGVCGALTTGRTHWLAAGFTTAELMGQAENPIRAEMDHVAQMANLAGVVNLVLNTKDEVVGCFYGDPVAAHRAACRLSREVFSGHVDALADVVVIESYPGDIDLWQASKALAASEMLVRPGGVVILVTPSPEGVSSEHPAMLDYGYRPVSEVEGWVERGEMTDLMVAAELAIGGRVIRERARGIMVSTGISAEETCQLGMEPAASPQEALEMALHALGADAGVLVVRHGGEILPVVG